MVLHLQSYIFGSHANLQARIETPHQSVQKQRHARGQVIGLNNDNSSDITKISDNKSCCKSQTLDKKQLQMRVIKIIIVQLQLVPKHTNIWGYCCYYSIVIEAATV
jgi:hypothetical protein